MIRVAAIVTVYNEDFFLPHLIRHYEREVDKIFVMDNGSDDGSVEPFKNHPLVEVTSYKTDHLYDTIKLTKAMEKKRENASNYDYFLILDADEFVVAKERMSIKSMLMLSEPKKVYGTDGYNMYTYDDDPPLDPERLLIDQRKHGVRCDHYSKPIVIKNDYEPDYVIGCHFIQGVTEPQGEPTWERSFRLLHYRAIDEERYLARALRTSKRMNPQFLTSVYRNAKIEDFKNRIAHEKNSYPKLKVVT